MNSKDIIKLILCIKITLYICQYAQPICQYAQPILINPKVVTLQLMYELTMIILISLFRENRLLILVMAIKSKSTWALFVMLLTGFQDGLLLDCLCPTIAVELCYGLLKAPY